MVQRGSQSPVELKNVFSNLNSIKHEVKENKVVMTQTQFADDYSYYLFVYPVLVFVSVALKVSDLFSPPLPVNSSNQRSVQEECLRLFL